MKGPKLELTIKNLKVLNSYIESQIPLSIFEKPKKIEETKLIPIKEIEKKKY